MIGRSEQAVLLVTTLVTLSGCVGFPGASHEREPALGALNVPESTVVRNPAPYQAVKVRLPHAIWGTEMLDVVPPAPEPALVLGGFECAVVVPTSPTAGYWRLAGVSTLYYTPIQDIYSYRANFAARDGSAYYHFRFSDDAR